MSLTVSGFDKARDGVSSDEVLRLILELVPETHRRWVQQLIYEPRSDIELELRADRTGRKRLDIDLALRDRYTRPMELGLHSLDASGVERIVVHTVHQLEENILHEFGHSLREHLSEEAKAEWASAQATSRQYGLLSQRASDDEHESFAECYAKFMSNPQAFKDVDPETYAFFQRHFGRSR